MGIDVRLQSPKLHFVAQLGWILCLFQNIQQRHSISQVPVPVNRILATKWFEAHVLTSWIDEMCFLMLKTCQKCRSRRRYIHVPSYTYYRMSTPTVGEVRSTLDRWCIYPTAKHRTVGTFIGVKYSIPLAPCAAEQACTTLQCSYFSLTNRAAIIVSKSTFPRDRFPGPCGLMRSRNALAVRGTVVVEVN